MPDGIVDLDLVLSRDSQRRVERQINAIAGKRHALNLDIDERRFRQPLGRITGDVNEFEKSLNASNARVLAFGASTAVIAGVTAAFSDLVTQTIEVEATFADINRILNLTTRNFEKFADQLFDTGQKTASTFQAVSDAALEFARQGLGVEESLKRTSDALTLVRLTGLNAKKSVDLLTATVNAFNLDDSTAAVDKFVNVETQFAVSARDLVEGLSRVGSSAVDAKVDLDELNAAITAVQQSTGRGGAVIGNAFKTIFTRLQRTSTLEALERFNVEVRDIEGNILPAITILNNFARSYEGLADSSKSYLREQVAGVFQANILSAILKDLNSQQSVFNKSLIESRSAAGEAAAANERLNTSLSAIISQTGLELTELQSNLGNLIFVGPTKQSIEVLKNGLQEINNSFANVGTDSETLGDSFIQGFLKGIKNVIQGPAFIIAFGLIGKLLQTTGSFLKDIIPSLTGIKTESQLVAQIQGQIVDRVARTNALVNDVYQGNLSVEQAAGEILNDFTKQNIQLRDQEAILNRIAGVIRRSGFAIDQKGALILSKNNSISKNKAIPNSAEGFTPGILREQAAIEKGVGKAPKNARPVIIPDFKFANGQSGPLVANTSEYLVPNFDGKGGMAVFNQEMVDKYGIPNNAISLDQKSKLPQSSKTNRQNAAKKDVAARGYVPNAASSTFFSDLRQSGTGAKIGKNPSIFKAADESVTKLVNQLSNSALSAEDFNKDFDELVKEFELSKQSAKKLRERILVAADKAKNELSISSFADSASESPENKAKSSAPSANKEAQKGVAEANKKLNAAISKIAQEYEGGAIDQQQARKKIRELIDSSDVGINEQKNANALSKKEIVSVNKRLAVQASLSRSAQNLAKKVDQGKISQEKANQAIDRLSKAASRSAIGQERAARQLQDQFRIGQQLNRAQKKQVKSFSGGAAAGLAFGVPFALGQVEQLLFGGDDRLQVSGGRRLAQGALSSGGSLGSTGAAIGGLIGGPAGAGIGLVLGGLAGLAVAVNSSKLTFEELNQIAQNYLSTTQQTTSAARSYIDAQERVSNALASGNQEEFANAQKAVIENFEKIKGTELEKSFLEAGQNVEGLIKSLDDYEKERLKGQILRNTTARSRRFELLDTQVVGTPFENIGAGNAKVGVEIDDFGAKTLENARKQFGDFFAFFDDLTESELNQISLSAKEGVSDLVNTIISINDNFNVEDSEQLESAIEGFNFIERVEIFSNIAKIIKDQDGVLNEQAEAQKALFDSYTSVLENVRDSSRILSRISNQTGFLEKYVEAFVNIQDLIGGSVKEAESVKVARDFELRQTQLDFSQQKQSIDFATKNAESLTKLLKSNTVSSEFAIEETRKSINEFINNPQQGLASIKKAVEDGVFELTDSGNLDTLLAPIKDLQLQLDIQTQNQKVEQDILNQRKEVELQRAKNLDLESKLKFENESASLSRELELIRARGESERNIQTLERDRTELNNRTGFSPIERARQEASIERRIFDERQKIADLENRGRVAEIEQEISAQKQLIDANINLLDSNNILTSAILEATEATSKLTTELQVEQKRGEIPKEVRRRFDVLFSGGKKLPNVLDEDTSDEAFRRTITNAAKSNPKVFSDFYGRGAKSPEEITAFNQQFRQGTAFENNAKDVIREKIREDVEKEYAPKIEAIRASAEQGSENIKTQQERIAKIIKDYSSGETNEQKQILAILYKKLDIAKETGDIQSANALSALKSELELAALQAKRAQSFKVGFGRAFGEFETESFTFVNQIGYDIPRLFRDGMVDALNTAMDRAEDLEDALRQSAVGFLTEIRNGLNKQAVNNLLSGLGNAFDFSGLQTRQSGGVIRAQNGMYISGSRTGDKNPALLEDGEYVLNRNAVRALGGPSEIDKFNFGMAPRFNSGGRAFLNEDINSSRLSGLFLSGDNPELAEAREAFAEKLRKREEKRQKRTALRNLLISTAASSVLSIGSGLINRDGLTSKTTGLSATQKQVDAAASQGISQERLLQFLDSGTSINDSGLPNMRTGGVIKARQGGGIGQYAKKKYGGTFNNKLTGGYIGYQSGGSVAESAPLGSTGGGNMNNNVRININMNNDGSVAANVSADSNGGEDQATKAKRLGIELEAAVQKVLAKERRVGGAFHEGGRRK